MANAREEVQRARSGQGGVDGGGAEVLGLEGVPGPWQGDAQGQGFETIGQIALGGGLVSAGIFGLASRGAVRPAAVGWALGTGVAIGTYTTIDGLGARAAGDPLLYVAWLHLLFGPWIALAVGLRRGRSALPWLRRHGARSALGGVVATVGYGLAVWAFSRAGLAHMAALRVSGECPASEMDTLHQFEALSPLPGPHLSRPAPHHSAELSSRSS